MKLSTILLSLQLCLLLAACSTKGPFDPTSVNSKYTGVTRTDEQGNILGEPDERDWNLYYGDVTKLALESEVKMAACKEASVEGVWLYPARPNYFNGLTIALAFYAINDFTGTVSIYNTDGFVVKSFYLDSRDDYRACNWKVSSNRDFSEGDSTMPDGMYRVCYVFDVEGIGKLSGYGDILLTSNLFLGHFLTN
ncbi:MAG: hypothetical protein R3F48_01965 [Candidatus Zixiibacteriota bacterium]